MYIILDFYISIYYVEQKKLIQKNEKLNIGIKLKNLIKYAKIRLRHR